MTGTDGERSGDDAAQRPPASDAAQRPPASDADFDPYRFGRPDTPPPPEYAPPGYVPDPPSQNWQQGQTGQNADGRPTQTPPYAGLPQWGAPPGPQSYGPPPPYNPQGFEPYGHPNQQHWRPGTGQPNGRATTSLVLGIASIVLCFLTVVDLIPAVLAIVFGGNGLRQARVTGTGRGRAIAGIVCGAVGILLVIVVFVLAKHLADKCNGISSGSSAFRTCISRNL